MARRGQNEGSIYKRKDGRWTATIDVGYENGKRKRKSFYGDTRREVQEQLMAALRDRHQGLPLRSDERQTVEQFLRQWLEIVKPTVRESAWIRYEQYIRVHVIPALGKVALTKLSPQQVQALYAKKRLDGLSPTTVHHLHTVLHHALKDAMRLNLVPRNVTDLVDPPRNTERAMQVYRPDQVQVLLQAAREHRLYALFVLAVTTGMREGELLALKWCDLDLAASALQVRQGRQRTLRGYTDGQPKTRHGRRRILLTPTAVEALRAHRARQLEERLALRGTWPDHDLVFTSTAGTPLDPINTTKAYYRLVAKAGLPRIRFHDLRHTAATLLLLKDVPAKVVSEMLGHASIAITLDLYSHVLPDMQQQAAAAMEAVLRR